MTDCEAVSKFVLNTIRQNGLDPTPEAYAVYYKRILGTNPDLNKEFDRIISEGSINQRLCRYLCEKFIMENDSLKTIKSFEESLNAEIVKIIKLLTVNTEDNNRFGYKLNDFSKDLNKTNSLDFIKEALKKISEETNKMIMTNRQLQQELDSTSEQLAVIRSDFHKANRKSQIDGMTEVWNRSYFDTEIVNLIKESREVGFPLSLIMADIDHFKLINDTHGHIVGDQVLRLVAKTLVKNLKGKDIVSRYGGEEFAVLLPNTPLQAAERVAEILRTSLETKKITKRGSNVILGAITISLGVAELKDTEDALSLIARSDKALYKAKQVGRNRSVCAMPDE